MTDAEALENGFVYKGKIGIVPVYLTTPNADDHAPALTIRGPSIWEYVLDVQEFFGWIILHFKPDWAWAVDYQSRIDGQPMPAEPADL